MAAYLLIDTKITDDEAYDGYKSRARPIAEKHGGDYIARGGALDVVESELWTPTRLVIIRFPDMAAARNFIDDPDYAPLVAIRHGAAQATIVITDGL